MVPKNNFGKGLLTGLRDRSEPLLAKNQPQLAEMLHTTFARG
jgi:hypothetical protein